MKIARTNIKKRAKKQNHHLVENFRDFGPLFRSIRAKLKKDPYPCLKSLEINAHGTPEQSDGIYPLTVSGFAKKYKKILWTEYQGLCDETLILLNGCNSGLNPRDGAPSIAEQITNNMPFNRTEFPIHVTVRALAGYGLQGTSAMEKNMKIVKSYRETGKIGTPFKGSRNAKGRAAWNTFTNW